MSMLRSNYVMFIWRSYNVRMSLKGESISKRLVNQVEKSRKTYKPHLLVETPSCRTHNRLCSKWYRLDNLV